MSAVRVFAKRLRCSPGQTTTRIRQARLLSTTPSRNSERGPQLTKNPFARRPREDDTLPKRPVPVQPRNDGAVKPSSQDWHFISPKENEYLLPMLSLRDMCTCQHCVDPSTRQKLFSTADIPPEIIVGNVEELPDSMVLSWINDVPGFSNHTSTFDKKILQAMATRGSSKTLPPLPRRRLWKDSEFRAEAPNLTYEAYMQDDATLYRALQQLHSHGLLFLKDVPESADSISRITQRIGPLKNTFYGETWDVRSVPKAKNVAYTSQNLGFHMDLLYMKQPPHLQFLHCIRSSASGGASLFTDSFKAVSDLYQSDENHAAFCDLESQPITFHYDHIDSHYYQQSRPLIELAPLRFDKNVFAIYEKLQHQNIRQGSISWMGNAFKLEDYLEAVSWAPPFQAPFQVTNAHMREPRDLTGDMESNLRRWHKAARQFNQIIHDKANIHERMMKPGECVIFDNRRVLHARKAFEVADAGKERWLRGTYLDKDPFISKLRVLADRFQNEGASEEASEGASEEASKEASKEDQSPFKWTKHQM